jgi:integrase
VKQGSSLPDRINRLPKWARDYIHHVQTFVGAEEIEELTFWAERFPDRQPEHFVFPSERVGGSGSDETFGLTAGAIYESDPTLPVGDIKTAWGVARKHAGLSSVRIHDLRHSAVSRMIAARTPLPIISKIVGWSPGTMAKMAARYGHFSLDEMRSAVDSISGSGSGYPQFSPQSTSADKAQIQ